MSEEFVDRYKILEALGTGSMGVVYKAIDPDIDRVVAIKTLRSMFLGNDEAGTEALNRFKQESRSAGRLQHPNIVTIYSAGKTEDGSPFIVMEHIEGDSLEGLISAGKELPVAAVLHYLAQIASAIDYAHSHNIIHRDIKPSNVIVDAAQRPQLLDFGVAKMSDTSLTPAGTVVGTPSYMSPEQIRGEKLTGKSDLFSFAVLAYELFTLKRPFPGKDFTSVVSNIIHKEPLSFEEIGSSRPAALEEVLGQGLSKDKDGRFETAIEFVKAMATVLNYDVDASGIVGGYIPGAEVVQQQVATNPKLADEINTIDGKAKRKKLSTLIFIVTISLLAAAAYFTVMSKPNGSQVPFAEPSDSGAITEVGEGSQVVNQNSEYVVSMSAVEEQKSLEVIELSKESLAKAEDEDLKDFVSSNSFSEDDFKVLILEAERRGGEQGLWIIRQALSNDSYKVRVAALKSLGKNIFSDETSFELISDRLKNDKEFLVRGFAAKLLGQVDKDAAINVLTSHKDSESNKIVLKVIDAQLNTLGDTLED